MADPRQRPLSAIPSPVARGIAFAAIVVAGAMGGVVGWVFIALQTDGDYKVAASIGAAITAIAAAAGTAVISVLALRAMGEWRSLPGAPDGAVKS